MSNTTVEFLVDEVRSPLPIDCNTRILDLDGLDLTESRLRELLSVDNSRWAEEVSLIESHFAFIGERLPNTLVNELEELKHRLQS